MLHQVAVFLVEKRFKSRQEKLQEVAKEWKEAHVYYTELLLETILTFTVLLFLSFLLGCAAEALIFSLLFMWFRGNTGGYHTKNAGICMVMTILVSLCASLSAVYYPRHIMSSHFIISISILFSLPVIFLFAPINHPSLSLTEEEAKQCRRTSRRLTVVCTILLITLSIFKMQEQLLISASLAVLTTALSVLIARILKQEVSKNETDGNGSKNQI